MPPDDAVARLLEMKREMHPELHEPLTWDGLRRVCAREGVLVAAAPLERPATLLGYDGVWIILVNSATPRRHTHHAAHELGHLWLHVDGSATDRFECCYHMDTVWPDDPREDEAEMIATLLLMGPERAAARYAPFTWKARPRPKKPPFVPAVQLPMDLFVADASRRIARTGLGRGTPLLAADSRSDRTGPVPRIETEGTGAARRVYFVDREHARWRVHDLVEPRDGSHRRPAIPPIGHAVARCFVRPDRSRVVYEFRWREVRDLDAELVERQLLHAISSGASS